VGSIINGIKIVKIVNVETNREMGTKIKTESEQARGPRRLVRLQTVHLQGEAISRLTPKHAKRHNLPRRNLFLRSNLSHRQHQTYLHRRRPHQIKRLNMSTSLSSTTTGRHLLDWAKVQIQMTILGSGNLLKYSKNPRQITLQTR
jgi:hypothetical protein